MIEIIKFENSNSSLFKSALDIRNNVFVKEQKIDPKLEYDENDVVATHFLLYENGNALATARYRETSKGIKLERFAVLATYRNRGLGARLLEAVLNDVKPLNKLIYLHSQKSASNLYLRNGFRTIGHSFFEAGIEHLYMEYSGE